MGPACRYFFHQCGRNVVFFQECDGSPGGHDGESHVMETLGHRQCRLFILVLDRDKNRTFLGQFLSGSKLGFGHSGAKIFVNTHDFACGFHLRPKNRIHVFKAVKGHYRFLDTIIGRDDFLCYPKFLQGFAQHNLGGKLGQRHADSLGDKGNGPGCPGIDFNDVHRIIHNSELDVH